VVTGFQGVCAAGDVTSLGRGGSDTTAAALAASLEADACEIYTDVDGIYTADPRLIPDARLLEVMDSRDMLALACAGSRVLHPKSVELALAGNVPLTLLSSFREGAGTAVKLLADSRRPRLAGLTGKAESGRITLAGKDANAASLSEAALLLADNGIQVQDAALADRVLSLFVLPEDYQGAAELLHRSLILPQYTEKIS
jgi:aspartate kinase